VCRGRGIDICCCLEHELVSIRFTRVCGSILLCGVLPVFISEHKVGKFETGGVSDWRGEISLIGSAIAIPMIPKKKTAASATR
jgi:hypothetical protein